MRIKNILVKIVNNKIVKAIFSTFSRVIKNINGNRIYNKGAELAYYMVIGLLTILVTVVYAAHFIPNLIQTVDRQVLALLPDNIKDLILNALLEIKMPKSISVIIATSLTSIWFVSRAMHSIMVSFNEIYGVADHKIGFKSKAFSILFTLALVAMFLVLFSLTIVQGLLSGFLEEYFHLSTDIFRENEIWETLISAGILLFIFNALYYYLPDKKLRWYFSVPGAMFATITWLLMSKGFTLYITSISSFSWILGSFGSIFIFLIWIYYSALFLLIGAVINSIIMRRMEAKLALRERNSK